MSESSIRVFKLESEQSAFDLLSDLLDGRVDADTMQIDFSSATWAKFDLTGEQYHSTINADLTRALVEYQNTLYRVAAYLKTPLINTPCHYTRPRVRENNGCWSSRRVNASISGCNQRSGIVGIRP